ncbi:bacterial transferase hexapeptide family protein, partial [Vibrio parahaemolyticus V-223/04]
STN